MLTHELMRRLARLTASRELETVPVEVLGELLDCANEALIEVWLRMPPELRVVPVTEVLRAPATVAVAPTTGRRHVGNTLSEWEGCALQLPDDPYPNRLISENTLERPHQGNPANDGVTTSALVWHDAIRISENASMVGSEAFIEVNGAHSPLDPCPYTYPLWGQTDVTAGTPGFYAIRASGVNTGRLVDPQSTRDGSPELAQPSPGWWMHVLPRPSAAGLVRFTLSVQGERITHGDYRANRRLLLPDRLGLTLGRLAEQNVMATRLFTGDDQLRRAIDTAAERARVDLKSLVSSQTTSRPARVGTPLGW